MVTATQSKQTSSSSMLLRNMDKDTKSDPVIRLSKPEIRKEWYTIFDENSLALEKCAAEAKIKSIFEESALKSGSKGMEYLNGFRSIIKSNLSKIPDSAMVIPIMVSGFPFGATAFEILRLSEKSPEYLFMSYSHWQHEGQHKFINGRGTKYLTYVKNGDLLRLKHKEEKVALLVDDKIASGRTISNIGGILRYMHYCSIYIATPCEFTEFSRPKFDIDNISTEKKISSINELTR